MTAAVAENLDLSWVTFTGGGDGDCCDRDSCAPLEAVALAYWDRACCEAAVNPEKLCAPHADETRAILRQYGPEFECGDCGALLILLKLEPIR